MRPTRRRLLAAALGGSAFGLGAVLGTGAFTATETSRDFRLAVVPDADAQLALRPGATGTDAIESVGGTLAIDIDGANLRADTAFRQAIEIENNHQSGESVFVYVPRSMDVVNGTLQPTSDVGHASVEFVVDNNGQELDISLPWTYPGQSGFGNADPTEMSIGFGKVTNTGALELAHGESAQVDLRLLVTPSDEDELGNRVLRVRADRAKPVSGAWDEVGALDGRDVSTVLDN